MTASACCQAHSGAHKPTQLIPKRQALKADPHVCLCAASSPRAFSPGALGDQPKELLSWSHSRTALRNPKSACLSPVSATTLLPPLKWNTETRVRFLLNHHRCTPQRPPGSRHEFSCPPRNGPAPSSTNQLGAAHWREWVPRGPPFSLRVFPLQSPPALCAYSGLWRPSQSLLSLSGSLSATWGTQA